MANEPGKHPLRIRPPIRMEKYSGDHSVFRSVRRQEAPRVLQDMAFACVLNKRTCFDQGNDEFGIEFWRALADDLLRLSRLCNDRLESKKVMP